MSVSILTAALSVSASNSLSASVQEAKPIYQVAPTYSHDLRAAEVEGEVVVSFTISATGNVLNPSVVSSTDRHLENATLAAVRKWKFTPALKDGVAISVKAVQAVAFVIPEIHPDASRLVTLNAHPASQAKDSTSLQ